MELSPLQKQKLLAKLKELGLAGEDNQPLRDESGARTNQDIDIARTLQQLMVTRLAQTPRMAQKRTMADRIGVFPAGAVMGAIRKLAAHNEGWRIIFEILDQVGDDQGADFAKEYSQQLLDVLASPVPIPGVLPQELLDASGVTQPIIQSAEALALLKAIGQETVSWGLAELETEITHFTVAEAWKE